MQHSTATTMEENKTEEENSEGTPDTRSNQVMGSYNNTDLHAGGDISIINQHYEPDFFPPILEGYKPDRFIGPIITQTLVETIRKDRFLILGGDSYDKSGLTRHIAWNLLNLVGSIAVKEWTGSTNVQNLEQYIQKESCPTIFILPNISPQNVDYNLSNIYKTARERKHYAIISSNIPFEKWKMSDEVEQLSWQPTPNQALYASEDLVELLIEDLSLSWSYLPNELQHTDFTPSGNLMGTLSLQRVAEELKTPESIEIFVKLLTCVDRPLSQSGIQEIINQSQNDKRTLRQWFYHSLTPRSQLIAIGLCLFEGLYDDQFFSAMEILLQQSWNKWEPSVQNLDYCDLAELSHFFRLNPLGRKDINQIEGYLPEQRLKLIEILWEGHRRKIYGALPVLEELVKQSVENSRSNLELYGTYPRRRLLWDVMGETLCHIGLKPEDSIQDTLIENTLLRLATEDNFGIQAVVARAIALWRFYEQDDKLFDTLQRWQEDKIQKILNSIIGARYSEHGKSPKIFIKVTVALAVGFAAQYDRPNQLHEKLCTLLSQLAEDCSNRYIKYAFANYALPIVVRVHTTQIRKILYDMTKETCLHVPIAISLANAIQEGVKEAAEILNDWYNACSQQRPTQYSPNEITHRDKVLVTVIYTYGSLQYADDSDNENKGIISIEEGFQRLGTILQKENHPYIRQAIITAISWQISSQSDIAAFHVKKLLYFLHPNEHIAMLNEIVSIHLKQRTDLENGDFYFKWNKQVFSGWVHGSRPLTIIEKVMQEWLKDNENQHTAQMALKFRLNSLVNRMEREEERQINTEKERLFIKTKRDSEKIVLITKPTFAGSGKSAYCIKLVARLLGYSDLSCRKKLETLLPIALKEKARDEANLRFAFKQLDRYSDEEIASISDKLLRGLFLLDHKNIFLSIFAVMMILLLVLVIKTCG